jgi:two-component system chemotaxis sensor kinase CheA
MDISKYKALFVTETTEHLQAINSNLVLLEQNPSHPEAIHSLFRSAHSIKGMAASMGFDIIRDLAHALEDLMDDFRQGRRAINRKAMDLLFQGLDLLEGLVKEAAADKPFSLSIEDLLGKIRAQRQVPAPEPAAAAPATPAAPLASAEDIPDLSGDDFAEPGTAPAQSPLPAHPPAGAAAGLASDYTLKVVISRQATAPSVRGLILFKRAGELGRVVASRPSLEQVKQNQFLDDPAGLAVELELKSAAGREEVLKVLNSLAEVQSFDILEHRGGAASAAAAAPEPGPDPFAAAPPLPRTVRVQTRILDQFINAVGEMILVKSELREVAKRHPTPGLDLGLDRLERLIRDFHDLVMGIRLMPLDSVVQRLPRTVRDLARDQGKNLRFEIKGKEIELDRAILEQLGDPLLHLLRNAVSHGIESPEERQRAGKDPAGAIEVLAYRERDMVLLEVRDDGRGMDPFQLKEVAVEKQLLKPELAETLSDDDAFQLIFLPGFSTAREVGLVSGRGVGMDVVRSAVEGVGGFVSLVSAVNKGSTITLHLPRTISIINVLLVRLNREVFALPISKVQKTVEILEHQVRKSQKQQYFLDRQELVPIHDLRRFLNLPEDNRRRAPYPALVVEVQKRKMALMVDEFIGQEEAFIRPLGKPLERISGLSGVTMLGDGRIVFVLDTLGLM